MEGSIPDSLSSKCGEQSDEVARALDLELDHVVQNPTSEVGVNLIRVTMRFMINSLGCQALMLVFQPCSII